MNSLKLQFRLIFSIVIIYTNWSNKPLRSFRVILWFILGFYEDHIWIIMVYQINKIKKQFHICYQWHSIGRGSLSLSVTLPQWEDSDEKNDRVEAEKNEYRKIEVVLCTLSIQIQSNLVNSQFSDIAQGLPVMLDILFLRRHIANMFIMAVILLF